MFTKFANEDAFASLLTEGMREYLPKEEERESTELLTDKQENRKAFSFVVEELVKCAEELEKLGHPLYKEVDKVLADLEVEFQTLGQKKEKVNPWAICTKSVGRDDPEKFERCVLDVKKQHGLK